MVAVFLGGVVGSTLSAVVYTSDGWTATCALGAGFAACASVIFAATRRLGSGAGQAGPPTT
jgi:ABC-type uncharacterized transport system permease subunit